MYFNWINGIKFGLKRYYMVFVNFRVSKLLERGWDWEGGGYGV